MRGFFLIVGLMFAVSNGHGAAAAQLLPASRDARPQGERAIRMAQNGHRDQGGERGSVVEGCGVRDALCVANRLLMQMAREAGAGRRAQIEDLGRLMQRACGTNPKDVVCAGEFVSRGLALVTGPDAAPAPIFRERDRSGPGPVAPGPIGRRPHALPALGGLTCLPVRGNRGLFPARAGDNRTFGGWGLDETGPNSCAFAIRHWNPQYEIVCTQHGRPGNPRYAPQNIRDAYAFGPGVRTLRECVEAVTNIADGAICATQHGAGGYRMIDVASRRARGPTFLSLDQCLAALDRRR